MTEPGPVARYGSKDSLSSDYSSKDDLDEQWVSQVFSNEEKKNSLLSAGEVIIFHFYHECD